MLVEFLKRLIVMPKLTSVSIDGGVPIEIADNSTQIIDVNGASISVADRTLPSGAGESSVFGPPLSSPIGLRRRLAHGEFVMVNVNGKIVAVQHKGKSRP